MEAFKKLRFEVVPLAGSASPQEDAVESAHHPTTLKKIALVGYENLRAQMFHQLSEDLRLARLSFAPETKEAILKAAGHSLLLEEKHKPGGKRGVTGKEEIRKAHGESPNELDAIAYWNWVRIDRAVYRGTRYS